MTDDVVAMEVECLSSIFGPSNVSWAAGVVQIAFAPTTTGGVCINPYTLRITLPRDYPNTAPTLVRIDGAYCTRRPGVGTKISMALVAAVMKGMEGCPVMLSSAQWLMDYMAANDTNDDVVMEHGGEDVPEVVTPPCPTPTEISVLAMHHIYCESKKQCVVGFAAHFGLKGMYLFGKPGRVAVEGPSDDVRQYEHEIRRLKWSKCVVLGRVVGSDQQLFSSFERVGTLEEMKSAVGPELGEILVRPFRQCV